MNLETNSTPTNSRITEDAPMQDASPTAPAPQTSSSPVTPSGASVNVANYLNQMAAKHPFKRAVVYPVTKDAYGRIAYAHLTFEELLKSSDRMAHGLEAVGISRGVRTILMVKPGPDFFSLTFALFKVGAIPVVVDPGMGVKRMLRCLAQTAPQAFIGIPLAHVLRTLYPGYFKTVTTFITVGSRWFWGGKTLKQISDDNDTPFPVTKTRADDIAAILFTTGSTGPAKGVVYTQGTFDAQIKTLAAHFEIGDHEIDLPTFPLFALFDPALGMTAVIPDMDPTKPAQANPAKLIEAIKDHGVTNMFASPALLNRLGRYGMEHKIKLHSLKRVVSAGAPVSPANIQQFSSMLKSSVEIHTPYGATEAVPVLSIASQEILTETKVLSEKGFGTCVGRPIGEIEVRLIRITDEPISKWSDDLLLPIGDVGEIIVRGGLVTRSYYENTSANEGAKITDGDTFWHRMGDLGWMDQQERIWFCGRKNHRVVGHFGTLYTIPCEAIFNNHPDVFRSALVGVGPRGDQLPVICIELEKEAQKTNKDALKMELLDTAHNHVVTRAIDHLYFHKGFPVDIRHNSKIFREKLSLWAEKKMIKDKIIIPTH